MFKLIKESNVVKEADFANEIITEKLDFSNCKFECYANFRNTTFLESVTFENATFYNNVDFSQATFKKKIILKNAKFDSTCENIYFKGTKFTPDTHNSDVNIEFYNEDYINFKKVIFNNAGNINFNNAKFSNIGCINFEDALFNNKGEIDFRKATFNSGGNISFYNAEFNNKKGVNFRDTEFNNKGDINFNNIKFNNLKFVSFRYAKFSNQGNIYFSKTIFKNQGDVDFWEAAFVNQGVTHFINIKLENNNHFIFKNIKQIYSKIIIEDCELKNWSFLNTNIHNIEFINPIWEFNSSKNRIILYDEMDISAMSKLLDSIDRFDSLEKLYRNFKIRFKSLHDNHTSDYFYHSELIIKSGQNSGIQKIFTWDYMYKITSDFGFCWWLPLVWILVIFLISSMLSFLLSNLNLYDAFIINLHDTLFIKSKILYLADNNFLLLLLKIKSILMAPLVFFSGVAIWRKHRS